METAVCYIHADDGPMPIKFMHEHHKNPRAYGGDDSDSNLVWLCAGCHDFLHRMTTMYLHGKRGLVEDYIEQYLPFDLKAQKRFMELVLQIARAKEEYELTGPTEEDVVKVMLEVPVALHGMLKILATESKMGLARYILHILTKHVEQRHGITTDPYTAKYKHVRPVLKKF